MIRFSHWVVGGVCVAGLIVGTARSAEGQKVVSIDQTVSVEKRALDTVLNRKVTVKVTNVSLAQALQTIASRANTEVLFNHDMLKKHERPVSLQATDESLRSVFGRLFKGTPLEVVVRGRQRLVVIDEEGAVVRPGKKPGETSDTPQGTGTISGKVIDSTTRKGVADATVSLNPGKITAVSKADGSFSVTNVPYGEYTVTVRKFGHRSSMQRVKVQAEKGVPVEFLLGSAPIELNEVVTTVTGQQRKREIGNDITTINVEEVMKQAPITSVTDLLEARVPGLTVMRSSGVPGASSRIRLRGIGGGLLSGVSGAPTNDPIVIVDGIRIYAGQSGVDDQKLGGGKYPTPSPIDQIDPNSIEKIEVLKGPSAAAMYGADAGDGVIVITTKKGKAGTTRWDIAASRGTESMPGAYAAPGYYRFGHAPRGTNGTLLSMFCPSIETPETYFQCDVDSLVRFQALNESRLSTLGRGSSTRVTGTASGGTNNLTYSVTGSMANTLGLTKMPALYQDLFWTLYDSAPSARMRRPNSLESHSGQASFSGEFGRGVTATFTTSLSQSVQTQSSANDRLAHLASVYIDTSNISPGRPGQYAYQLNATSNSVKHALALNLARWEWFPLTGTVGVDRVERSAEGLTPRGIVVVIKESWNNSYSTNTETALSKGTFTERHENIVTTTGRINGTLFPRSRMSVSIGSEITQRSNAAIDGQSDTLVEGISRPSTLVSASRSGRTSTTGGWFLEPRLNMNSRFFVNPGFRLDGGGISGSRGGFRGGLLSLFPKLNFSWIAIDREGREPLFGAISLVRPRLAFGIAGVQPAAEWSVRTLEQHVGNWAEATNTIAPDLGLRLRSVGNTRLGPEKTQEVEGGVDLQLWETRLTLSATGFYKMRKNAIQQLPLAPSVGALGSVGATVTSLSYYANIGHVRNTGAEITLNVMVLDLPNIGWNIDLSISKYTNTLTKLFGEQKVIEFTDGTRLIEGYPLFGRWSRPISGWTTPANSAKLWYSDYAVADSAVYLGMQAPDFEMPFRTSLTFFHGLLTVNGQFHYKAGLTQSNLGGGALLGNIYDNPNATYGQQAYALAAACFLGIDDRNYSESRCTDYGFIQKINSLRFNSMSVSYTVPRTYLKRFPMSSVSLSLQGSNLGLWTNYRGKDPDVNGNLIGDVTQDSGQLPMPRTWSFQIRIGT